MNLSASYVGPDADYWAFTTVQDVGLPIQTILFDQLLSPWRVVEEDKGVIEGVVDEDEGGGEPIIVSGPGQVLQAVEFEEGKWKVADLTEEGEHPSLALGGYNPPVPPKGEELIPLPPPEPSLPPEQTEPLGLFASAIADLPLLESKRKRIKNVLVDGSDEIFVPIKDAGRISGLTERQIRWGVGSNVIKSFQPGGHDLFVSLKDTLDYPENKKPPGRPRKQPRR